MFVVCSVVATAEEVGLENSFDFSFYHENFTIKHDIFLGEGGYVFRADCVPKKCLRGGGEGGITASSHWS